MPDIYQRRNILFRKIIKKTAENVNRTDYKLIRTFCKVNKVMGPKPRQPLSFSGEFVLPFSTRLGLIYVQETNPIYLVLMVCGSYVVESQHKSILLFCNRSSVVHVGGGST